MLTVKGIGERSSLEQLHRKDDKVEITIQKTEEKCVDISFLKCGLRFFFLNILITLLS